MRTHTLAFAYAATLAGCIEAVGSEGELAEAGDLAETFLGALDLDHPLYRADADGGPFPYVVTEYLEEGDTIADGLELVPAWGGRSLARTPDGREMYLSYGGAPSVRFVVAGALEEGTRVHLVLDAEGYEGFEVAVVDEDAGTAQLLGWSSHAQPVEVPMARGPAGEVGRRGLDETVALRWLRTCPGLLESCVLYGAPADVEAAVDPIEPEGGWFLHPRNATLEPPAGARMPETSRHEGAGAVLVVTSAPTDHELYDVPQIFHRAWLEVSGRRVHAFDFIADEDAWAAGGVARDGDRLIVWHWRPEYVDATFSEHDARTGERIGEPLTLDGEMYFEAGCSNGISSTRPTPVRVGDDLAFALWWGGREALLFDGRSSYGSQAEIDVDPDAGYYYDMHAEEVPAVLRLAD
jgi:hypothetical protein